MCEVGHPDELMADFQQYYGIDVWPMVAGSGYQVARAAALAWQLPRDGRAWAAVDPLGASSTQTAIIRQIEHDLRLWMWAHTKDAQNNSNQPEPMPLPGEAELAEAKAEEAQRMAASVASQLGLFGAGTEGGETDG